MPEVVPLEVRDPHTLERLVPRLCRQLSDRRAAVGEDALGVPSPLPREHLDRRQIQRHGDCLARLRLIGMDPGYLALEIDLLPGQPVTLAALSPVARVNVAMSLRCDGNSLSNAAA